MLEASLQSQLKTYLERLVSPIALIASVDDGASSSELTELLHTIAGLTDKITVTLDGTDARKPSFLIQRVNSDVSVRFAGIPLGHEFTSLVLALLQVSGYAPKVEAELIDQAKALAGDYAFETFFSLSLSEVMEIAERRYCNERG